MNARPQIIIIGAGFGGLAAAHELAKSPVDVLLLDRHNYHLFLPLLYQVAAAEVASEAIAFPIRRIFWRQKHSRFVLTEVTHLDRKTRTVAGEGFEARYDYLIVAAGSAPHFFGVPGADQYSFPLKSMDDGVALRNHLLNCFERAVRENDAERRRQLLTFVIAGAGPTGVEFAGALAELVRRPLVRDYPQLNLSEVKLLLLESEDRILPKFPEKLSQYADARLRRKGVEVRVGTKVSRLQPHQVELQNGECLQTETLVWMAGVRGIPEAKQWGLPTAKNGQVKLQPTLQVPDHPEIFVIGDLALFEQDGQPLPMIAPVAVQQGVTAARNIARQLAGQLPEEFRFHDPGMVLTVGRNVAVADIRGRSWTGFSAWLLWLAIHIYKLIGFRNRLMVLINWAWDYLLYESAVRLILTAKPPRDREHLKDAA